MRITVLGSGIVGQATGRGLLAHDHSVTFLDTDSAVIGRLRHEGLQAYVVPDELPTSTTDVVMVCINTPGHEDGGAINLAHIKAGMKTVADLLTTQKGRPVVVIRSTVPPTTTEKVLIPAIEAHSGLKAGQDFGVCTNPEFLRAKSAEQDFAHPWSTVIGQGDPASGDVLERLYEPFGGKLFRTSLSEAELIKYTSNLRNALVISFSNEMWRLGQALGIDANQALSVAVETAESAWNPKYGSTGGYPIGGSCLPKDSRGLYQFARDRGCEMPLLEALIDVNDIMIDLAHDSVVPAAQIAGHNWRPSPTLTQAEQNGKSKRKKQYA